jgi:O-antigen/teichoic acid export membrane protein
VQAARTSVPALALVRNSSVQIAGQALSSLISVFTFAAMTRGLGPHAYGHYAAALAFLGIPMVFTDLGLSTGLLRAISRNPGAAGETVSVGLSARATLSVAILGLSVAVATLLSLPAETTHAIMIAAVASLFLLIDASLVPALQAQLKMHWSVLSNISGRGITLALTVAFLAMGGGLGSVLWAYAIGNAATLLIDGVVVNSLVRLRLVFDFGGCLRLLRSTLVLGLVLAVDALFFYFDTLLLGVFRSSREVGLYAGAFKVVAFVLIAGNAVHVSVFPAINRYLASNDPRLSSLLDGATRGLLILCTPIVVVSLLAPETIMSTLSGRAFEGAGTALRIFSPLFPLMFLGYLYSYGLIAAQRERALLAANLAALAVNLGLFCAFVPAFGINAAAAVGVASAALLTVAVALIFRRQFGHLPSFSGVGAPGLAAAAMVPTILVAPGPPLLRVAIAGVVYMGVLALLPGAARQTLHDVARVASARWLRREKPSLLEA